MILYIASHYISNVINEAIEESGQSILQGIVESKFSFSLFIRQQLGQLQTADIMLVDLTCLTDSDEEISNSLSSFRMLYETTKIIIIASNREVGDKLLSEIFNIGIYNILIPTEELEDLKNSIVNSIANGMNFKDSIKFKLQENENKNANTKNLFGKELLVKEKIIIKNEIKTSVNKALIGFVGSQERIGVTHNAIVSGYFLKDHGYRIAIVENSFKKNKCFQDIRDSFDLDHEGEDYFTLNSIDFYSDYNFKELHKILTKNYNFIILDFGLYEEIELIEFSRCVMQIVICGSKPWELINMDKIFTSEEQSVLEDYIYLFNYTDLANSSLIKQGMQVLKNVYFAEYTPDPFNSKYYDDLKAIFKEYLVENTVTELQKKKFSLNGLKNRILKK